MSPMSTEGDAVEVGAGPSSTPPANGSARAVEPELVTTGAAENGASPTNETPEPYPVASEPDSEGEPETSEPEPFSEPDDPSSLEASVMLGTDVPAVEDGPAFFDELEPPAVEPEAELDPLLASGEMTPMLFVEVVLMLPATHPVVVLQEADAPFRELRIPVGGAEGIAIAYAARGIATPRPLTHELFARLLEEFTMTIDVVRITEVSGTAFSAEMVVSGPLGSRLIDCRPSDAIALALRARLPVPIVASSIVLAIAGTDPLGAN